MDKSWVTTHLPLALHDNVTLKIAQHVNAFRSLDFIQDPMYLGSLIIASHPNLDGIRRLISIDFSEANELFQLIGT